MKEEVTLTAAETRRYGRHLVLPEVGPEGQRKLKGPSALVVGVGGLGIPAAVYLGSARSASSTTTTRSCTTSKGSSSSPRQT